MKTRDLFLATALFLLAATGCTHNRGDIGPYFGAWKLESVTIDGKTDPDYTADNVFWKFQTIVICMSRVDYDNHSSDSRYGTWEENGNRLTLDFTNYDNSNPAGSSKYSPLKETHLPSNAVSTLEIISQKGSTMKLEYISEEGVVYGYELKKW